MVADIYVAGFAVAPLCYVDLAAVGVIVQLCFALTLLLLGSGSCVALSVVYLVQSAPRTDLPLVFRPPLGYLYCCSWFHPHSFFFSFS